MKEQHYTLDQKRKSGQIKAAHDRAKEEAVETGKYVLLNGMLWCPSGQGLAMPWYVPKMEKEVLKIVESLGGKVLPQFEPSEE